MKPKFLGLITLAVITILARTGLSAPETVTERVIVYTAPGCAPCKSAIADLRRVVNVQEERDCPVWVTQVPTVVWQQNGKWVQHAPKHWKSPTWRQEWPRLQKMLKQ